MGAYTVEYKLTEESKAHTVPCDNFYLATKIAHDLIESALAEYVTIHYYRHDQTGAR